MVSGLVRVAPAVLLVVVVEEEGFWSWARISRSGVERRSGWRGESGVGSLASASGSAVLVGGTAERVRASQSARSALSLEGEEGQPWLHRWVWSERTHLSSSRSSSSAFAALAMLRGFGALRRGIAGGAASSRENQSLSVPLVTRSFDSSACITRARSLSAFPSRRNPRIALDLPACNAWNSRLDA